MAALGKADLPIYLDTWDGYPWARERLYALLAETGVTDALVLTGDSHAFWLNALHNTAGAPRGLELGTTGITSPGGFCGVWKGTGGGDRCAPRGSQPRSAVDG